MDYLDIPRDEEDFRFTQSFDLAQELDVGAVLEFFDTFGFVVFKNALTPEECEATKAEMFSWIESQTPEFKRDDPSTWSSWTSRTFGMPALKEPVVTPQFLRNRQNPRIFRAFSTVLGTNDLLVNHDRWALYRSTVLTPTASTRKSVHLDFHPLKFLQNSKDILQELENSNYDSVDLYRENNAVIACQGRAVQAVLNLNDNAEEDGGLVVVPGFHRFFPEWTKKISPNKIADSSRSYDIDSSDPVFKLAKRIPMAAGSIALWDQTVAHGSSPNTSENYRAAQFMKMFPATNISAKRRANRAKAVESLIRLAGFENEVSDVGRQVFGLL
eukprot:TRINITY_DN706_c0_g1_i1.p1 TRINITY_DN706_c0_g1~~TRINITY_DN706_c0_g1_i1.p1  ORF type:complete len:328 (-),score=63.03 TRINITY_DN706_c0_g1_i1:86-1069(-)